VLPWTTGGSDPDLDPLEEAWGGALLRTGALLGLTVICKAHEGSGVLLQVCVCTSIQVYKCTCVSICTSIQVYMCIYLCVCVCRRCRGEEVGRGGRVPLLLSSRWPHGSDHLSEHRHREGDEPGAGPPR